MISESIFTNKPEDLVAKVQQKLNSPSLQLDMKSSCLLTVIDISAWIVLGVIIKRKSGEISCPLAVEAFAAHLSYICKYDDKYSKWVCPTKSVLQWNFRTYTCIL